MGALLRKHTVVSPPHDPRAARSATHFTKTTARAVTVDAQLGAH